MAVNISGPCLAGPEVSSSSPVWMEKIPSFITAYADNDPDKSPRIPGLGLAVCTAWDRIWRKSPPEKFIHILTCERTLDFCGVFVESPENHLFSESIHHLLLDMATNPLERKYLYNLFHLLKSIDGTLCIIPRSGSTSAKDGGTFLEFNIEEHPGLFVIELLIDGPMLELLVDGKGTWHLGRVCLRSVLLHEFEHIRGILTKTHSLDHELQTSWTWTYAKEKMAIEMENRFLQARGKMTRLCHTGVIKSSKLRELTPTSIVALTLKWGADGSMQTLCKRHEGRNSPNRITCDPGAINEYVVAYLTDVPSDREILSEVDVKFRLRSRTHKDLALTTLAFTILRDPMLGIEPARMLVGTILKCADHANRQDVISFSGMLRDALKV